jgi:alpha-D-ribose 1-methylphosphonate 5-triphosphate synthase subunit PhnH
MTVNAEALTGGFQEPVFDAQTVFKAIMDAMARPGSVGTVAADIMPPAPFSLAQAAIALTLCDHDTPVWFSLSLAKSAAPSWLAFHAGAPTTSDKLDARFAFLEEGSTVSLLNQFAVGTQEYPDRSTTVVLEISGLSGGAGLALSGPGIDGARMVAPAGLADNFARLWNDNRALYPRGVDLILTAGRNFFCLPRTAQIIATEM